MATETRGKLTQRPISMSDEMWAALRREAAITGSLSAAGEARRMIQEGLDRRRAERDQRERDAHPGTTVRWRNGDDPDLFGADPGREEAVEDRARESTGVPDL